MKAMRTMMLGALALPCAAEAQVAPGQWEIAMTIKSIEMPGAPAGVAAMMAGKTRTIKQCITPEQAARGPQEMLKTSKTCAFTRYSMAGGKLSSEMVCKQNGMTMTATSTGNYTPTSFNAVGRSVSTGQMPMTVTSTAAGRRVGDCKK